MLYGEAKKVLKIICKIYKDSQNQYIGLPEDILQFCPKRITPSALEMALLYLSEQGCIKCTMRNGGVFGVYLLPKGANYIKLAWLEVKTFLFRSIITPIAVSLVTSLLVLWITGAFQ